MPKTHRRTWQRSEGRAAALFGSYRQVGSGSGGRADLTASDSVHPTLFVESKLRNRHTTRTLHDATKRLAGREGKTPVLALFDKGRPGFLLVVHSDDLAAVTSEFAAALTDPELEHLEGLIRQARTRNHAAELPADVDPPPGCPPSAWRSAEPADLYPSGAPTR